VTVLSQANDIHECASAIDHLIVTILARESPVAKDLRMTLTISKIAGEIRYLSDEVCEIARLILVLYEPRSIITHAQSLIGIQRVIEDIRNILANLAIVLGGFDCKLARWILASDAVSENEIKNSIAQQLTIINHDPRQIKPALIVLQMIKSLESSSDHCKDLAKYCILMVDGEDVRHPRSDI
jgi:phosphate transport system protein